MTKIIISDLHLSENQPHIATIFFNFLRTEARKAESLYILGDFFETWIGDDDLTAFNLSVINALASATKNGLLIFMMHGNRDFLMGRKFSKMTGCKLLPDEYLVNVYGTPILMMHGDTLCLEDKKYLKFRKKTRNWFVQKLFLLKSLDKRRQIAKNYREASQNYISTLPDHIMDVTPSEVERVMQKHQVQHLIHGHTHRQAIHQMSLNNHPAERIVLGAWHEKGNAIFCRANGIREFVEII